MVKINVSDQLKESAMKSITSKISVITLSLLVSTFTFVLGTTSSNAVGDGNSFEQCVGGINPYPTGNITSMADEFVLQDIAGRVNDIIACANK